MYNSVGDACVCSLVHVLLSCAFINSSSNEMHTICLSELHACISTNGQLILCKRGFVINVFLHLYISCLSSLTTTQTHNVGKNRQRKRKLTFKFLHAITLRDIWVETDESRELHTGGPPVVQYTSVNIITEPPFSLSAVRSY